MKPRLLTFLLLLLLCSTGAYAQEDAPVASISIPAQNLLKFDRFLINPTFSTVNEDNSYLNLYHRNQWVSFDDNYQTYLGSYSGRISDRSGLGLSVYHQRFGAISNFGAIANYAYGIRLSEISNLTFGFNLSYYNSGVDKSNINPTQPDDPTIADLENGSLLTFQPGINLSIGSFDVGLYAEDAFDYNFKTDESLTEFKDKTFTAHLMYTNRFKNGAGIMEDAKFSALTRARRMGDEDIDFSGSLIFDMPKLGWLQAGYDDFYGIAAGIGFNLTQRLSLGYTIEKGIRDQISNFGVTHEVNFAYSFQPTLSENRVFEDLEEDENLLVLEDEEQPQDTITDKDAEIARLRKLVAENNMIIDEMMFRQDSMEEARKSDVNKRFAYIIKYINDNKNSGNQQEVKEKVVAMMKEMDEDAYNKAQQKYNNEYNNIGSANKRQYTNVNQSNNKRTRVSPQPAGNADVSPGKALTASTTTTSTNVANGAYVIANVYKTDTYMNRFLDQLKSDGIDAGYFENNGLKYVYIHKYNNLGEARGSYNTDFANKYKGKVWVLNVKNQRDAYQNDREEDSSYATAEAGDVDRSTEYRNEYLSNGLNQCTDRYVSRVFASDKQGVSDAMALYDKKKNELPQNGYYIIANVFSEKENADRYIKKLKAEGFDADVFTNPKNKYKYVYLSKCNNWSSALKTYKSRVQYKNDIWIMPMKST